MKMMFQIGILFLVCLAGHAISVLLPFPVPGTVTPMPFFIRLAETLASMRSGVPPKWCAAMAEARASEIGSVQPSAGAISCLTALRNSGQSLRWLFTGRRRGKG